MEFFFERNYIEIITESMAGVLNLQETLKICENFPEKAFLLMPILCFHRLMSL